MGYYDGDDNRNRSQKGSKGGYVLASLVGVILGAILVIVVLPKIFGYNLLPYDANPDYNLEETDKDKHQQVKHVKLDVTTDVTDAVEKAKDTVVGISNMQSASFWGDEGQKEAGTGSGVIYKKEGDKAYIVTNFHVIEGAEQLEVTLSDGTKIPAKIRGGDIWTDLAVLEVDGKKINKIAQFGNSDSLKPGEPVIAIGNPLGLAFSGSVTNGIISGLERTIPVDINRDGVEDWQAEVIQTDAAINPGNSGGALVNIAGQVVGINSMKIAQQAVEGIGLSIPINFARPIIEDLEKYGEVKRPAMGVTLRNVNEISAYHQQETLKLPSNVKEGVMVEQVVPNSPAAQAGLKELDVIVGLDDHKVQDIISLRKYLYTKKDVGDSIQVKFYRGGKLKEATVKLTSEKTL
ncbi:serine protease Do [Oikeobacillus pervagus]|uniref:Serine protease Do n=1 Tax=Oikeobacillus pervagus TaxID=1325931 RepID=A0AAJ1SYZ1_9BACI|nr:trypsin-like peptidase domain-containing protein [Oikeobacillus pervagus]MDQ0215380.1 serine protease Do [Oikeobacillus pervagus]